MQQLADLASGDGDDAETLQAAALVVEAEKDIALPWLRVDTIDAQMTGTTGDITLTEVAAGGDVTLLRVAQTNDGGNGNIQITAENGTITVAGAGGSGVTTLGSGAITIDVQETNNDLVINQVITSISGAITLTAEDSVDQNADITSTAGAAIAITATSGAITMQSGTTTSSVAGNQTGEITLTAETNVLASIITADGTIAITATTGFISDNLTTEGTEDSNLRGITTAVTLTAATGIGASDDHLDTTIATLTATLTDAGGLYITEDDDLTINADGIIAQGATGTVVVISETGTVLVTSTVAFDDTEAPGRIRLEAAANSVDLRAKVDAGTGAISVLATGGDVLQQDGGDLTTDGGTIDVEAVQNGEGGNITITDGVTSTTAGGDIRYRATTLMTLTGLDAGTGTVSLISTNGSIVDAGDTNLDVQAAGLRVSAAVGTGTGDNHLDINVSTLSGSADSGGLFFSEVDTITVGSVTTTVQRTTADNTLVATTDNVQSDLTTTNNGAIVLVAGNAITVTDGADTDALGVHADGSGTVLLQSIATTVAIQSGVNGGTGPVSLRAGTAFSQTAAGDVTTSGAGTIDVEAGTTITMADGATTITAGGNIRYVSVNDMTVTGLNAVTGSTSFLSTAGSILDAGDTNWDVVAAALRLHANATGKGVGRGDQPSGHRRRYPDSHRRQRRPVRERGHRGGGDRSRPGVDQPGGQHERHHRCHRRRAKRSHHRQQWRHRSGGGGGVDGDRGEGYR